MHCTTSQVKVHIFSWEVLSTVRTPRRNSRGSYARSRILAFIIFVGMFAPFVVYFARG